MTSMMKYAALLQWSPRRAREFERYAKPSLHHPRRHDPNYAEAARCKISPSMGYQSSININFGSDPRQCCSPVSGA
jgi:hypothetical protein